MFNELEQTGSWLLHFPDFARSLPLFNVSQRATFFPRLACVTCFPAQANVQTCIRFSLNYYWLTFICVCCDWSVQFVLILF